MTNREIIVTILCNQIMLNFNIKFIKITNPILTQRILLMEETELIAQAQAGDRKALARLVKNYEQTIYNFAFKVCRDKNKAEHIMQETFLVW